MMGEGKAHSGMWSHQPYIEMTAPQLSTTFGGFLFFFFLVLIFIPQVK